MTRVTPYPWPSSRIVCVCVSTPTESKGKEKKLSRLSPSYVTLSGSAQPSNVFSASGRKASDASSRRHGNIRLESTQPASSAALHVTYTEKGLEREGLMCVC